MIKVDVSGKEVMLVDGPERTEVDDDDEAALLRDVVALQAVADKETTAEGVATIVRRDLVRLIKRGFATFTLHLQDLEEEIEELKQNPPGADGHVLLSVDDLKRALVVLGPICTVLEEMSKTMPTETEELRTAAASYAALAQQQFEIVALLTFKVKAYEDAEAEAALAEAEEEADGEGEGGEGA